MMEIITLGGLSFEVRRSTRRKKVSLTLDRGGELIIHAPDNLSTEELSLWTQSKLLWVHGKLALREELISPLHDPEYITGERFGFLGRTYRLLIVKEQKEPLYFDGISFLLREDARAEGMEHFRRWYIAKGMEWVTPRIKRIAPKVGVRPERIEIRDLGYRWGSCGKNQVLYFNWKGLQLPVRLLDYLLLHELAHLMEPNHTSEFRRILERALPDWKQRKEELRCKARDLFWCGVMTGG